MNKKKRFPHALTIVTAVLGAGGGIFFDIAPPGEFEASFVSAIAVFTLITISLCISGLVDLIDGVFEQKKVAHASWLLLAFMSIVILVFSSFSYYTKYTTYVIPISNAQQVVRYSVIGDEFTYYGKKTFQHTPLSMAKLVTSVAGAGEDSNEVIWTRRSIAKAKGDLMKGYLVLIVALGFCVFAALEIKKLSSDDNDIVG